MTDYAWRGGETQERKTAHTSLVITVGTDAETQALPTLPVNQAAHISTVYGSASVVLTFNSGDTPTQQGVNNNTQ